MSRTSVRRSLIRSVAVVVLIAFVLAASGCSGGPTTSSTGSGSATPAEKPAAKQEPAEPKYTSWVVYINDDDSYAQGGVTYSIALNLTATNPTGEVAGAYKGSATAKTDTNGDVGGGHLAASAIAKSSQLTFKLEDPTAGGQLGQLTTDTPVYSGTGTITMKAAGMASVGPAGGGFGSTSSQKIDVRAEGSNVTLSVVISGHKYTFKGTISGK